MILVSVGTQLPFDRLIRAVDAWAIHAARSDVIAQIGPSSYQPIALRSFAFLDHAEFLDMQKEASLIVSHAGMGSIITAMELGKPIIVMARDHHRGEHRNGHQLATIDRFAGKPGIYIVEHEDELAALLDRADELTARPVVSALAPDGFADRLATYLCNPPPASLFTRFCRIFR